MFIATYAGRVSSVAFSSPLGLPLPPQNAPLPNSEVRSQKLEVGKSAPNLDQFVDSLSHFFALVLKCCVGFFFEVSEISRETQHHATSLQEPFANPRKRLNSSGNRFLP